MEDERIHERIEQLVAEEHKLYERGAGGRLSESEHRRLENIKVGLDQAWDPLRQRRALREAGSDPSVARTSDRAHPRAIVAHGWPTGISK